MTDIVSKLSPELQTMLKRKSSRDPSSRFTSKLHALLNYVTQYPSLVNDIGLAWVDEETFKMNKHNLSKVMGIKLNTLNVNLRDLAFSQQQPNKDGWTHWKKKGFTKTVLMPVADATTSFVSAAPPRAAEFWQPPPQPVHQIRLGQMQQHVIQAFYESVQRLWNRIADPRTRTASIRRAAEALKQEGQELKNSIAVLKAIIACNDGETVVFEQVVKFLAMFGPERTAMLKIASLLRCSRRTGEWLRFDTPEFMPSTTPWAAFDDNEPNCLVIRKAGGVAKVWNLPLVDAGQERYYLVDENEQKYLSWDDYFDAHPVQMSYMEFGYTYD